MQGEFPPELHNSVSRMSRLTAAMGCRSIDETNRSAEKAGTMVPKPYIVYFKYKLPTEKTQGAVKQFRVYATSIDEARRLITGYANYPHIEVLNIKAA